MAGRRLTISDLTGLTPRDAAFVIEYCKDFDARRAATAIGCEPDSGYAIRNRLEDHIFAVLSKRLESSEIDAEWALMEAVDNHLIARQVGNINASNTALKMVMQHCMVDAMASDKMNINVHGDKEIMDRLMRGRQRALGESDNDTPVSFL